MKEEKKPSAKEEKKDKRAAASAAKEKEEKKEESKTSFYTYVVIGIIAIIIVAAVAYLAVNRSQVSFPSFKQNFDSSKHVAFLIYNSSNAEGLYSCSILTIETISRPNVSIDYMVIENQTSCLYSPIIYGKSINITNMSASGCMKIENSEPSISLGYSQTNSTVVNLNHISIYGNDAYLKECPIAVELS